EENVRFDGGLRNQLRRRAVDACEPVAVAALVEFAVEDAHDGRGEHVGGEGLRSEGALHTVKGPCRVQPADVADEALVTVDELLPAGADRHMARGSPDVRE